MSFEKIRHKIYKNHKGVIYTSTLYGGGYFAGSNTFNGYVPCLQEIFSNTEKLFILKGTPGCGKSTLMKRLFYRGKQLGKLCIPIKCSADNSSFDGVVFPELSAGVADGTAPHVIEPSFPMINEKIIDISGDYDASFAETYGKAVKDALYGKSRAYRRAYSLLSAAGGVNTAINEITAQLYNVEKAKKYAEKTVRHYACASGSSHLMPCTCFNGSGFSFIPPEGKFESITFADRYGIGERILKTIADICKEKNRECGIVPSPVDAEAVCAVYLPGALLASERYFEIPGSQKVNVNRFTDKDALKTNSQVLRKYDAAMRELLEMSAECMKEAAALHEKAESIYSFCADHSIADAAFVELAKNIFGE